MCYETPYMCVCGFMLSSWKCVENAYSFFCQFSFHQYNMSPALDLFLWVIEESQIVYITYLTEILSTRERKKEIRYYELEFGTEISMTSDKK